MDFQVIIQFPENVFSIVSISMACNQVLSGQAEYFPKTKKLITTPIFIRYSKIDFYRGN